MSKRRTRTRKQIDRASGWIVAGLILVAWISTSALAWMMLVAGILLAFGAGALGAVLVVRRHPRVDRHQMDAWMRDEQLQIKDGRTSNSAMR